MILMQNKDYVKTNNSDDLVQTSYLMNDLLLLSFSWSLLHFSSHYHPRPKFVHADLEPMPYSSPSTFLH
jgi:hypothetical protein